MKLFLLSIVSFLFSLSSFSQIKSDNEQELVITTVTTTSGAFKKSKKITYRYKGKQYSLGYWGKHFGDIVDSNPFAAKEMNKFRTKRVTSNVLGVTALTFLVLTFVSATKGNGFNLPYTGVFVGSYLIGNTIGLSATKNIHNAANYYYEGETTSTSILNNVNIKLTYKF
ncbi:MAG: hypothetical protein J5I47_09595 [Vicingus serpentipes]|nr:hypothetical protein [Vicingus serpentipes]